MEELDPDARPIALQPKWAKAPKFSDLYGNYQSAQSDHSVVLSDLDVRKTNLEGGTLPKLPKGKSTYRPKLIRKQNEWTYPSLEDPFLNTEDMFEIKPRTFEDQASADQNSLLLNYQWSVKVDKVSIVNDIVHTIVDEGTVIVKIGWETDEEEILIDKEVPTYATPEESMQMIQQAIQAGEMDEAQAQEIIQSGQPMQSGTEVIQVTDIKLIKNQPSYEVCDTRNVVLDPTANGKPEDLQFIIHEYDTTLSDLKKEEFYEKGTIDEETGEVLEESYGIYKNLEFITTDEVNEYSNDLDDHTTSFDFEDKPRKKIRAYEYWGYWDINGDDQTEIIVATWVGKTLIRMEKSPYPFKSLPFSFASYMPVKGSIYGQSNGDLIVENQEIIGRMSRAMHDITTDIAVGQEFIDEQLLNTTQLANYKSKRTVFYRTGMHPKNNIFKQTVEAPPKIIFDAIQFAMNDTESLTGTKAFSQGINSASLGGVATGINSAMDATSKRALSILRRLSNSLFKDLASKTVMMNQAFLEEEEVIRVTNQEYVSIFRQDIAGEFDIIIDVSTPEKDAQSAQNLAMLLQTTGPNMHPGMQKIIWAKIAKLQKEPGLEQEMLSFEPEPDPMEEEMKKIQIENAQLTNDLLKVQIAEIAKNIEGEDSLIKERKTRAAQNIDSEVKENIATARLKNAQAEKIEQEADTVKLNFTKLADGTARKEAKEDMELKHIANKQLRLIDQEHSDKNLQFKEESTMNREHMKQQMINENKQVGGQ